MQLQTFFLVLSLLVFFFALGAGLTARRKTFAGYQGISKDAQQLARILKAETLRDGTDLVVRETTTNCRFSCAFQRSAHPVSTS